MTKVDNGSDTVWGFGVEDSPYVVLGPTSDTYVEIREMKANKYPHKLENLFTG